MFVVRPQRADLSLVPPTNTGRGDVPRRGGGVKLSRKAVTLLRKVKQHILEDPERIAMGVWRIEERGIANRYGLEIPSCGTVACIAGWTEILSRQPPSHEASDILGITDEQSGELFYDRPLLQAHNEQTPAHARTVADHIDRFIEKYT